MFPNSGKDNFDREYHTPVIVINLILAMCGELR